MRCGKKKLHADLKRAFPDFFPDHSSNESLLRSYLLADANFAIDPDNPDFIYAENSLHKQMVEASKPLPLHPSAEKNATQALRMHNDDWYASLRDKGINNPERLTVYQFYSQLSFTIKTAPKPK